MKKRTCFFCPLILFLVLMVSGSGCTPYRPSTVSGPGPVLGLAGNQEKVVTFEVVGKGLEPEAALTKGAAILMAERAAIADGYRQMVEKLRGVYVEAHMKAGFGTVDQETLATRTQSWLRGVEVVDIRRAQYGITEAQMQLRVYFAKKDMVWWPMGIGTDLVPPQDRNTIVPRRTELSGR